MRAGMAVVLMALSATSLVAQTPSAGTGEAVVKTISWPLDSGSRVRVLSAGIGRRLSGTLVSTSADTLVVKQPKTASFTIPRSDVVKLEVSRGQRTHRAAGALLGLVVGGLGGALLGAATYTPAKCAPGVWCFDFGPEFGAAAGAMLGAGTGLLVGYLIGASPKDIWEPVALPSR